MEVVEQNQDVGIQRGQVYYDEMLGFDTLVTFVSEKTVAIKTLDDDSDVHQPYDRDGFEDGIGTRWKRKEDTDLHNITEVIERQKPFLFRETQDGAEIAIGKDLYENPIGTIRRESDLDDKEAYEVHKTLCDLVAQVHDGDDEARVAKIAGLLGSQMAEIQKYENQLEVEDE